MGESVPIKGRCLRVNPQKKKMIMPDVILHTRNVMIPIIRPVPFKQSCDIPFSKNQNRHQILRTKNYRNNPALLFSETPLHTLYDPLRNSLEVNQNLCIVKNIFLFLFLSRTFERNLEKYSKI